MFRFYTRKRRTVTAPAFRLYGDPGRGRSLFFDSGDDQGCAVMLSP